MAIYNSFPDFVAAGHAGFARASVKRADNIAGAYSQFAAGVMARTNKGALIEVESTNYWKNNTFAGAAVGIIGSGGALPTGWGMTSYGTRTVHGFGSTDGIDWIELSWAGYTNASGGNQFPRISVAEADYAAAGIGQDWVATVWYEPIGVSHTNSIIVQERNNGSFLAATTLALNATGLASASRTFGNAAVNKAEWTFGPTLPNGQALEQRFRIGAMQLEQRASRTSPIATSGAIAARAADELTLNLPSEAQDIVLIFDDESQQTIADVSGAHLIDPAAINRPHIKSIRAVPQ